ncbi:DNA repair and recombination protein RadB [Archaeoglobus sulfaticallidus]|uniref:DNA repair and recombination protein RadB n=1 Tax=Archaeoglobus sulfaticallidus TaxID=1316941 RepID=UPI000AC3F75B|nr:DNA repair and recombination protein RadB [Archaeoglobus sulfaticallidus]
MDRLLGGGVEKGIITQIYGPSATGKTSICLMLTYTTAMNEGKVIYIDTEGLSRERVNQIFEIKEALNNVFLYEVMNFRQQSSAIREASKLCRSEKIDLIVVDSITALYRSELENDEKQIKIKRELTSQLTFLLGLARKYNLAVVVTNQMFTDVRSGEIKPLGGPSLDHLSKTIVGLEKVNRERIATLIKHRSKAEGERCSFIITDKGVEP